MTHPHNDAQRASARDAAPREPNAAGASKPAADHADHSHRDVAEHNHGHGAHSHEPPPPAHHEHDSHHHGGHGHGGHGHGGHGHGLPAGANLNASFAIATLLNVGFVAVEATYGVLANSAALLADATHNLGDVLGLVLAWFAAFMAKRQPSSRYTYGFRRTTVLAALGNAVLLLLATGAVAGDALGKLWETREPAAGTIIAVAAAGVVVNGLSAAFFVKHAHSDANVRGAFLHLLADAVVSLGVVLVGAILIWQPGWVWLDPAVSLAISAVILFGAWGLLRAALHLSLDGVPPRIDSEGVERYLQALPGVTAVHDLHIWAISTSESALTTHLVVNEHAPQGLAGRASQELATRFGINHVTVQLDSPEQAADCRAC